MSNHGGRQLTPVELLALCLIDDNRNKPRYTAIELEDAMKPHPHGEALDLLQASKLVRPKQTVGGTDLTGTLSLSQDGRVQAGRDFDAVLGELEGRVLEAEGRAEERNEKKDKLSAADFGKKAEFWRKLGTRLKPYRDRLVAFHQRAKQDEAAAETTPEVESEAPAPAEAPVTTPQATTPPDPRLSRRAAAGKNAA
jgi:hypothetical protein